MRSKAFVKSALSLALAATLALVPCVTGFADNEGDNDNNNIIYIKSTNDLVDMAINCRLDSYSRGKTFILSQDIDLNSYSIQIPVFRGSFDGKNHSISGFAVRGSIAPAGLFGIIETDGAVKNLRLKGNVIPSGDENAIGGIAGSNFGLIENCAFEGNISGKEEVGGIAGINEFSGIIRHCSATGKVTGQKKSGGIAGNNHGLIDGSKSDSLINVDSTDPTINIDEIESNVQSSVIERDAESERIYRSVEDAGGIAGFSDGIITNCTNSSDVGYNHIGYNIGGITGRNQGFIYGSNNYGTINGRREVGGITGQAEPFVASRPDSDKIGDIRSALHKLRDLVDKATRDIDGSSATASERLSNITDLLSKANDNVNDLTDTITDYVDENLEEVNRGSDILKSLTDRLDSIAGKLPGINTQITESLDELENGVSELKKAGSKAAESMDDFSPAADDLSAAMKIFEAASGDLTEGVKELSESFVYDEATQKIVKIDNDKFQSGLDKISKGLDIIDGGTDETDGNGVFYYLNSAAGHLKDGMEKLQIAAKDLESSMGYMEKALNIIDAVSRDITGVLEEVSSLTDYLSRTEPLKFTYIKSRTEQTSSDLHNNMTNLSRELESLNLVTKNSNKIMKYDLRAINDQFFVVMDLIIDEIEDFGNASFNDRIEDVSDDDINNSTDGKLQYCVNRGVVSGDINVGGIAGSMGIFNEQNPEDDNSTISDTLRAKYKLKAILQDCTNYGDITSKKDYVGAVCGISYLGVITDCKGFGNATSEDGDYIGGISGGNSTAIRNSYAKCKLSGKRYVGGIAGLNSTKDNGTGSVKNCITAIRIPDHEQYSGAVCGYDEGEIKNNFFFGDYAGINNASYEGKAEPLTFEELIAIDDIPNEFKQFKVTFMANDDVIKEIQLDYLDSYDIADYPDMPENEGEYGKWDMEHINSIVFDEVITAEYSPYVTALISEPVNDNEPGKFLAVGKFNDVSKIEISNLYEDSGNVGKEKLPAEFLIRNIPKEGWKVSATDLQGDNIFLRYYKGDAKPEDLSFYVKNGDAWEKAEATEVGTYMQFEAPSGTNSVIVAHRMSFVVGVIILAVALGLGAVVYLILRKKKRRSSQ